jgi:ferredoxin
MEVLVVTREGQEVRVDGEQDQSLMEAIRDGGVDEMLAICGGCLACATCHVYVDLGGEALPPPSEEEEELLESASERLPNSRLSCQIRLADLPAGLRVTIAPE